MSRRAKAAAVIVIAGVLLALVVLGVIRPAKQKALEHQRAHPADHAH